MNEELIELRNRFLFGLGVALVFTIPMLFVFINKFGDKPSKVLEYINNDESMVLFIVEEDCKNCSKTENILKENSVPYTKINRDRESKYEEILKRINIPKSDIEAPSIIYLKDGELHSSLIKPENEELLSFIDFNSLSS